MRCGCLALLLALLVLPGAAVNTPAAPEGETLRPSLTLEYGEYIGGARWNADETRILVWSYDSAIMVWDAASGQRLLTMDHGDAVGNARWNADESRVLSRSMWGRTVNVWDAATGEALLSLHHDFQHYVWGAVWNADETRILSWSGSVAYNIKRAEHLTDGAVCVWDTESGAQLLRLSHKDHVFGAMWNADESRILSWSFDGTVRVWDAGSGDQLLSLQHGARVEGARWNADESRVLTWSQDRTAVVWDARTGEVLLTLQHDDELSQATWSPDEARILTATFDTVSIWVASSGALLSTYTHPWMVHGAVWNADGSRILSWSAGSPSCAGVCDLEFVVWDARRGIEQFRHRHPHSAIDDEAAEPGAAWDPDEARILSWSFDGVARIWDAESGRLRFTLPHQGPVNGALWNADGAHVLTWTRWTKSNINTVHLWAIPFGG